MTGVQPASDGSPRLIELNVDRKPEAVGKRVGPRLAVSDEGKEPLFAVTEDRHRKVNVAVWSMRRSKPAAVKLHCP